MAKAGVNPGLRIVGPGVDAAALPTLVLYPGSADDMMFYLSLNLPMHRSNACHDIVSCRRGHPNIEQGPAFGSSHATSSHGPQEEH